MAASSMPAFWGSSKPNVCMTDCLEEWWVFSSRDICGSVVCVWWQIASAETALKLEGDAAAGHGDRGASAVFIRAPAAIEVRARWVMHGQPHLCSVVI